MNPFLIIRFYHFLCLVFVVYKVETVHCLHVMVMIQATVYCDDIYYKNTMSEEHWEDGRSSCSFKLVLLSLKLMME